MSDPDGLVQRVRQYVEKHDLFTPSDRLTVAVSGGLDSMVLLDVLRRLRSSLRVVHVHHGLHDEADATLEFVRDACKAVDVPFEATHVDVHRRTAESGASTEAAARQLRYRALVDAARGSGSRHVVAGHHRDDQAETVLMNLFRGSGPEGLAGMAPCRRLDDNIILVRPLLGVSRSQLRTHAEKYGIEWRDDPTNEDRAFRRNALRHDILPRIRMVFGEAAPDQVAHAAELMQAYLEGSWEPELDTRFQHCRTAERGLSVDRLARQPRVWRHRLVLEALAVWLPDVPQRRTVAAAVADLLDAQPGRRVDVEGGTVWRDRELLRFVSESGDEGPLPASGVLRLRSVLHLLDGMLRADVLDDVPPTLDAGPEVAYLDAKGLPLSLTVRRWQNGDRFQPLGMDGSRLVSDFLTDAKVAPSRRREVLVVLADGEIAWVAGYRPAEPFKVRASTSKVVRLVFESAQ